MLELKPIRTKSTNLSMKSRFYKVIKPIRTMILSFMTIAMIGIGTFITTDNLLLFSQGFRAEGDTIEQLSVKEATSFDYDPVSTQTHMITKLLDALENTSKDKTEPVLYPNRPLPGDELGELYIPKLDATLPIYHGTEESELSKGVGHYAGSVLPGENDNSVLSGHRDTVFRNLGKVGEGDILIVRTSAGEFEYVVNKVRIVDDDDRTVIVPKPSATLTVSTCYPFRYIGPAPNRYVLVAYLSSKTLYTDDTR